MGMIASGDPIITAAAHSTPSVLRGEHPATYLSHPIIFATASAMHQQLVQLATHLHLACTLYTQSGAPISRTTAACSIGHPHLSCTNTQLIQYTPSSGVPISRTVAAAPTNECLHRFCYPPVGPRQQCYGIINIICILLMT
jgi:hypothetical protein